jgi:hypothetical protein
VLDVWMSHGDRVDALPPGFTATAGTSTIPFAAMSDERRRHDLYERVSHAFAVFLPESSTRWPGSRASSTTSPASRRRSSGSR